MGAMSVMTSPAPRPPSRPKAKKKRSVVEAVSERLFAMIRSGKIGIGDRLPSEHQLMATLGVGRSSVREAVRGLVLMGLLERKTGGGTILVSDLPRAVNGHRSLAQWAIEDLYAVRALLEPAAAAGAARHATAAEIRRIADFAAAIETHVAAGTPYFAENIGFHLSIAAASGNPLLYHSIEALIGSFRDVRERINRSLEPRPTRDPAEHRVILAAIRARDAAAAEAAMAKHLKSFRRKASVDPAR
jgi:GntR family transcriptional regulator, transcriptional repressor for pyruvate dehydrogenase complex